MKILVKTLLLGFIASTVFFSCKKNDNNNNTETLSTQDRNFIMQAAIGNTAEIQAGQLADSTTDTSLVQNFATMLVNDHQSAQSDLKSVGSQVNANVPDSANAYHMMLLDTLRGYSGRAFDSAFIMNQIMDHTEAINQYQAEASAGNNTAVMNYANTHLPVLQKHLNTADSIATVMNFK